jgi:two-component system sensor histidine kinase UhpB
VDLLVSTHDAVVELSAQGLAARDLGGRRADHPARSWIGHSLETLVVGGDRDKVRSALRRARRGRPATIVVSSLRDGGQGRALQLTITPRPDDPGNGLAAAVLEVPDRRRAEARIERLTSQLTRIQQLTHIGSWHWDAGSGAVSCSDELHRICGLQPEERDVPLEDFLGWVHPEDRDTTRRELKRALHSGEPFLLSQRIVRLDGAIRFLESRAEVRRGLAGEVLGLEGTSQDVTEALAQEAARREAESRLRQLVESVQAILWRSEATNPGFTFVSREAEALLGYAAERWLGEPSFWMDHLHPDDREWVASFRLRATEEKRTHELEYRMIAADGRVVWLRDVARVVAQEGEARGLVGVMIDITDSRRSSDELRRSREQLRDFSAHLEWVREQERSRVSREIHDELGQALSAIKMDLGWLMRRLTESPGRLPRAGLVDRIGRMSRLADDTIESVRRICRALRPGVLDDLGLPAAIEWQAREFEARAGVRCEVRSDLGEERLGRDLATEMFRIFQEALTNVGRHAAASRVEVGLALQAGRLVLTVRDDGRGVAAEGPGRAHTMGLLGMRERARRLGGSLTLSGPPGEGTEIVVNVPMAAGAAGLDTP